MVELRMGQRDRGSTVGRGYEVRADDGSTLPGQQLHPERFPGPDSCGIVAVPVTPENPDQRRTLSYPAFGVGRVVRLRPAGPDSPDRPERPHVAVFDEAGEQQAGVVDATMAGATSKLLERHPELVPWVRWEWLGPEGRTGIEIALSGRDLVPTRLAPPPQRSGPEAPGWARGRGTRLAAALLAVVALMTLMT